MAIGLCAAAQILTIGIPADGLVINSDDYFYRDAKNGGGNLLEYDSATFGPTDKFFLPLEDMAPLGLRPDDNLGILIGKQITAVPIAPNYVVTASHWKYDPGDWMGRKIFVGRDGASQLEVVNVFDGRMQVPFSQVPLDGDGDPIPGYFTPGGGLDVVVLKLGPKTAGQQITQLSAWASFRDAEEPLLPGQSRAVGSYGPGSKRIVQNDAIVETIPAVINDTSHLPGNLAWALRRASADVASDYVELLPYSYAGLERGDSGAGYFVQNGWNWDIHHSESVSSLGQPALDFVLNALRAMENDDNYVIPGPPTAPPDPTNVWLGSAGADWGEANNWSRAATPSSVDNDIVRIAHAIQAAEIAGAPGHATELYIGAEDIPGTVNLAGSGSLSVVGSIYLGPEAGDTGQLSISGNATLAASNINVAVYGQGVYTQTCGQTSVDSVLYVGKFNGSHGTASISSTDSGFAVLNAQSIVLGDGAGSLGDLLVGRVDGSGQPNVTAEWLVVGNKGDGLLQQFAESTVTVDRLILGHLSGSQGVYELTGNGELNAGETAIGMGGGGVFHQSAGIHNAGGLNIGLAGTYILDGGNLNLPCGSSSTVLGSIDFGAGTLTVSGLADFASASLMNTNTANVAVENHGLLILPEGFDIPIQMAALSVDATSTAHVEGSGPIVIADGRGVNGFGIIREDVVLQGDAFLAAAEGQTFQLRGNLLIEDAGAADLGLATAELFGDAIAQPGRDVTLDLNNGTLRVGLWLAKSGFTLTANGLIVSGGSLDVQSGATLDVGPDIDDLTLNTALNLAAGSTLKMEIGGLAPGEHDYLAITSPTAENVFDGNLELRFVNDFFALPGDELNLIGYTLRASHQQLVSADPPVVETIYSEFAQITHNGPLGLLANGVFDDAAGAFSVRFTPWSAGDIDLNGIIDGGDFSALLGGWGATGATWLQGDFNGDGLVDGADFSSLLTNWGKTIASNQGISAIPEPSSSLLLVVGGGLFAALRRRP